MEITWQERKEPTFTQFADGEVVSGILVGIKSVIVGKDAQRSQTARYTVQTEDQGDVEFLGTYQLNSKLRKGDIGHFVMIRCEGSDPNVVRNGSKMKLFKVSVSAEFAPGWGKNTPAADDTDDPSLITDADIPF